MKNISTLRTKRQEPNQTSNEKGISSDASFRMSSTVVWITYTQEKGETLYRVRLFGYNTQDDTYETIQHLQRSRVIRYYRHNKAQFLLDIDKSMVG